MYRVAPDATEIWPVTSAPLPPAAPLIPAPPLPPIASTVRFVTPLGTIKVCSPPVEEKVRVTVVVGAACAG
jgi:hypothetical protein